MDEAAKPRPSFSTGSRWGIGFHVVLAALSVLALAVMLNYLATRYFTRFQLSPRATTDLSPQSHRIIDTLTNDVTVSVVFNAQEANDLYGLVTTLLKQYDYASPHIQVQTVDYTRNPGRAELLLSEYKLGSLKEKNFVVFECGGRTKVVPETELADVRLEPVPGTTREFARQLVTFKGEMRFTSALLSVISPKPARAYFLKGHREHDPSVPLTESPHGYASFAGLLKDECNIDWATISLQGAGGIPPDCTLLIIAGPRTTFLDNELQKIDQYLEQGGRALILLNSLALGPRSGIEELLAKWNVAVADTIVLDPQNSPSSSGLDLLTASLNDQHEVTRSLFQDGLSVRLVLPRTVGEKSDSQRSAESAKVTVLAGTGENGTENDASRHYNPFVHRKGVLPLIVAVERGTIEGVTERGTRMVVTGDSLSFDNELLDTAGNRYFATMAVNWLLDRPQVLLDGLVPRPVEEYKVIMTDSQKTRVNWLLLGAMPGGVLLFGGLVWLRRRS